MISQILRCDSSNQIISIQNYIVRHLSAIFDTSGLTRLYLIFLTAMLYDLGYSCPIMMVKMSVIMPFIDGRKIDHH